MAQEIHENLSITKFNTQHHTVFFICLESNPVDNSTQYTAMIQLYLFQLYL